MKKIHLTLSKETLRDLTLRETEDVLGGGGGLPAPTHNPNPCEQVGTDESDTPECPGTGPTLTETIP